MMPFCVRLLGTPGIRLAGNWLELAPGKSSAVLYFLAHEGGWVSRDRLLGLFWPDKPEVMAQSSLRKLLSTLRRTPHAVGLEIGATRVRWPVATDLRHFRQTIADRDYPRAVGLYEGELLHGFSPRDTPEFDAWLELERKELQDVWRTAALELAGELEMAQNCAEWVKLLTRLHKADPLDEEVLRRYLRALHGCGQHSRALRTFESFCQMLRHEVGSEPEATTVRQVQQLRQEAGTPVATFGQVPRQAPTSRLPVRPTSFIGRMTEKARVVELINDPGCRMVTITGPGGVGKTRLALEIGAQLQQRFAHGAHFVPLASTTSADLAISAIASALALMPVIGDSRSRLLDYLRDKELLLILDNFEHLLEAADFVSDALAEAPRVKVLVTSRTRLHLYSEHEYILPPLAHPKAELLQNFDEWSGHEAMRLFVERARAVKRQLRVNSCQCTRRSRSLHAPGRFALGDRAGRGTMQAAFPAGALGALG
jgi:DNA-binding SARP family transcriptional activator